MLLDDRWFLGSLFLSLDMTEAFFEDLWVPIEHPGEFQVQLRDLLEPLLEEKSFYDDRSGLGYLVIKWFHQSYGSDSYDRLNCWIRRIFVLEGPDRPAETLWHPISLQLPHSSDRDLNVPEWILVLMDCLKVDQESKRELFDEKTDALEDQQLTEWDRRVLAIEDSSTNAAVIKMSLIAEYNIFLAAWEDNCSTLTYAQLYELWNVAKRAAIVLGMDDLDVPFPGGWRFELAEFLNKFARAT